MLQVGVFTDYVSRLFAFFADNIKKKMANKKNDGRIDTFRDEALGFVAEHLDDMKDVFKAYMKEKNYDKAVALYMKLADKVIPALATQAMEADNSGSKSDWMQKIDKAKKTVENKV